MQATEDRRQEFAEIQWVYKGLQHDVMESCLMAPCIVVFFSSIGFVKSFKKYPSLIGNLCKSQRIGSVIYSVGFVWDLKILLNYM